MERITVILERGNDSSFSAYIQDNPLPFGLIGDGNNVAQAKEDFMAAYEDMKDYYEEQSKAFPCVEFSFKYDIPSFLQYYAYAFTLAGLERITGVHQKQLGHYIAGIRKPSEKTIKKIETSIHNFGSEISAVNFI